MYNANLHVLHVAKEESRDGAAPELEIRDFVKKILPFQKKVVENVRYGQPYREIVNYARDEDIDLIVITTHGRTGLTHMVMGSVAEKIVRFSPVPVLTIKPPKDGAEVFSDASAKNNSAEKAISEYST